MQRADLRSMFGGTWGSLFGRKRRAIAGPAGGGCAHTLGRHLLRTCRSTQSYPDGNLRPPEIRGGRLVVDQSPCVWAPGHAGEHKTTDGRAWS
jgi:hypothetical protein